MHDEHDLRMGGRQLPAFRKHLVTELTHHRAQRTADIRCMEKLARATLVLATTVTEYGSIYRLHRPLGPAMHTIWEDPCASHLPVIHQETLHLDIVGLQDPSVGRAVPAHRVGCDPSWKQASR
mgnify:FL=1